MIISRTPFRISFDEIGTPSDLNALDRKMKN